jgi:hypothetical protein
MQTEDSLNERHARRDALQSRLSGLNEIKTKLRKLNIALGNLAVADVSKQLGLITAAAKYIKTIEQPPSGVRPLLTTISNELQSLREGILARVVKPSDLVLTAGVRAVSNIDEMIAKVNLNLERVEAAIGDTQLNPNEALILRNQKAKEKIPTFNGKDFVVARAPVAFTFQNKQNHSSIGYVDKDLLEKLGFKSDNIGGYTIIHNQLMIGIDSHAVYDKVYDVENPDPNQKPMLKRKRVKESVVTFKGGKPTKVMKARDRLHIDIAKQVKRLLETKAGQRYEFVSEKAVGLNGGEFFWLMPSVDHTRFAKAFGGGHAKIASWGFAF